ncbi:MAG: hypothetical protein HYY23_08460 [Verrucomicrobia bacterium]|nr:hypothetical protein [Verrucomicrobiota bacterium]
MKTQVLLALVTLLLAAPCEAAKIAWVSFHSADGTPSGAAATAGFTKAVDVDYTELLKANGHTVTRIVTSGTPNLALLTTFDLVIISRSVPSGDYQDAPETAAWHSLSTPTMILGGYVLRANRLGLMTGNTIPDTAGPVALTVNNPAHAIFAGITLDANKTMMNPFADIVSFNDIPQRGISVITDPVASGGTVLAKISTDGDPAFGGTVIAEWRTGATMSNASADKLGGSRLVFLTGSRENSGLTAEGAGIFDLTEDGKKLFLNAVSYAATMPRPQTTQPPPPPPAQPQADPRGIAWVSFHSADNRPSAAAATAGFTNAVDVAYTDLLKKTGYSLTRIVSSGTPNATLLNGFGLVIISRSVPSADYQDPPETAAWHGIKAPAMILGGYVLRANRMGFVTGNSIPDTVGPVNLNVNDPAHPIFAGVALDANNTMVNAYADVVSFNDVVQRGISVNSDAISEGGVVLATIGSFDDPAYGGTVIAEWKAGATMSNASADANAGKRLVFLTGSRENSGLTAEGAGIYDLKDDGAKMFLNAVKYMLGAAPAPSLKFERIVRNTNGSLTITWSGGGTLQSTPTLSSPTWAPVASASSPHTVTPSGGSAFYRLASP